MQKEKMFTSEEIKQNSDHQHDNTTNGWWFRSPWCVWVIHTIVRNMLINLTAISTGHSGWKKGEVREESLEKRRRRTAYKGGKEEGVGSWLSQVDFNNESMQLHDCDNSTLFILSDLTIERRMRVSLHLALFSANSRVLMSLSRTLYLFICSHMISSTHLHETQETKPCRRSEIIR